MKKTILKSPNSGIHNSVEIILLKQVDLLESHLRNQSFLGQYSCLENPMGRGAWQATVHGFAESRTQLSN